MFKMMNKKGEKDKMQWVIIEDKMGVEACPSVAYVRHREKWDFTPLGNVVVSSSSDLLDRSCYVGFLDYLDISIFSAPESTTMHMAHLIESDPSWKTWVAKRDIEAFELWNACRCGWECSNQTPPTSSSKTNKTPLEQKGGNNP